MLDWLIVGGGLHGSHIACRLSTVWPNADVAVLDSAPSALSAWQQRADACGMSFLRSSQAHHLGMRSDALRVFAREHGYDGRHTMGRYRRPSRALFEAHVDTLTQPAIHIHATAEAIESSGANWRVVTADNTHYTARHVVLAPGPAGPARPDWGTQVPHVFDKTLAQSDGGCQPKDHIVVVGGGITAAQYAITRAQSQNAVTLLTRHELRQTAFDSQPCYSGPRCLRPFLRLPMSQRLQALADARNPGTLPADIYTQLATYLATGAIRWVRGDVATLKDYGLRLNDKRDVPADRIVLATGFTPRAGALIEQTATRLKLPLDEHGYAPIGADLAWAPGLYVTGRPASLQLGPMAGNIRGAQLAARRLAGRAVSPAWAAPP